MLSSHANSTNRVSCIFFHEDSHRQATKRSCRLIARNPNSDPWHPGLCRSCPVPAMLRANPCVHLALEARVERKWGIFSRVVPYVVCAAKFIELSNPTTCYRGCDQFQPSSQAASDLVSVDALMASAPVPRDGESGS